MTLMPQQAAHFIAHVQDNEPNWYSLTLLGFATGARPSELLCAQVGDLDLEREVGVWRITRHWGVDGTILPGTKTSDGEIVPVDLDPGTTVALREHLAEKTASEWLTAGYKGRPPGRNAIRQFLRRVRTALGLESTVTGKVFRQTNITLSRMAGIADVIVMSQHGHSSLQMTETYTRIPSEAREAAARKFGNVIPLPLKVGTEVGTGSEPESDAG